LCFVAKTDGRTHHPSYLRKSLHDLPPSSLSYGVCGRGGELFIDKNREVHEAATANGPGARQKKRCEDEEGGVYEEEEKELPYAVCCNTSERKK
jgi:hypothetical protein